MWPSFLIGLKIGTPLTARAIAPEEVLLGRHRLLRGDRMERNPPGVVAGVLLGQRHLLLPGGDADHHRVVGDAVRLDVEESRSQRNLSVSSNGLKSASMAGPASRVASGPGRRALGQEKEFASRCSTGGSCATRSSTQARSGSLRASSLMSIRPPSSVRTWTWSPCVATNEPWTW